MCVCGGGGGAAGGACAVGRLDAARGTSGEGGGGAGEGGARERAGLIGGEGAGGPGSGLVLVVVVVGVDAGPAREAEDRRAAQLRDEGRVEGILGEAPPREFGGEERDVSDRVGGIRLGDAHGDAALRRHVYVEGLIGSVDHCAIVFEHYIALPVVIAHVYAGAYVGCPLPNVRHRGCPVF